MKRPFDPILQRIWCEEYKQWVNVENWDEFCRSKFKEALVRLVNIVRRKNDHT